MTHVPHETASRLARRLRFVSATLFLSSMTALSSAASPQREFVNYEVGPVHPVTANTFQAGDATRHVVMVCNTAHNALEFYDTTTSMALIKSIPTGLAPVTVRWDEASGAAYTCNHIGDSVTKIAVAATAGEGGGVDLDIDLLGTYRVGDEPCDMVFIDAGQGSGASEAAILISLRSRSALAEVDPATMEVRTGGERIVLSVPRTAAQVDSAYPVGVKNPGVMLATEEELYVLDRQSDDKNAIPATTTSDTLSVDVNSTAVDDLDLYLASTGTPLTFPNPLKDPSAQHFQVSELGTTHHDMTSAEAGKYLLIVGMDAQASVASTEAELRDLPTGFAQSWLWVMYASDGSGGAPILRNENDGVRYPSINLNRDYTNWPTLEEVGSSETISQPTGVAILESSIGVLEKVVVTAFSSDRVAVLTPSAAPGGWAIEVLDLAPIAAASGGAYSMAGPRGVYVDSTADKAYVSCSLDNSVRCIDLSGTVPVEVQSLALDGDDTPAYVRAGREFLYGAMHSTTGTVSCASCHIDGHTDGIAWVLDPADDQLIPTSIVDTGNHTGGQFLNTNFPHLKGSMVTQSLRGLVNYEIREDGQDLVTNAPYHWRGDREDFPVFKKAFPALLGSTAVTDTHMETFTRFINSVVHPPNPEQPIDRRLTGDMGPGASITRAYDPTEGSGMKRGLKVYHTHNLAGVSCVHCHATPEGSGNRISLGQSGPIADNPIESAALRNIFDFESLVMTSHDYGPGAGTSDIDIVRVKSNGLFHDGQVEVNRAPTINHFMFGFSGQGRMPGLAVYGGPNGVADGVTSWVNSDTAARVEHSVDLTEFVRGLDTGTAPAIGWTYNFTNDVLNNAVGWSFLENQAKEANIGVVLHTRISGVERSYWYDITAGSSGLLRYDDAVTPLTAAPSVFIGGVSAPDIAIAEAVPIGSARRIADRNGAGLTDSGPSPSNVTLEPMAMATHWEDAGDLKAFWDDVATPLTHHTPANQVIPRRSHQAQLFLQQQLIDAATGSTPVPGAPFGLDGRKHEPPRRVRVSGDDIRPGAELTLIMTTDAGLGGPFYRVKLPLFPTSHFVPEGGARIWETAIEFDAEMTLALLNGGPEKSGVKSILDLAVLFPFSPGLTDPADNSYHWNVANLDSTVSGWQQSPLTIQNFRW